MQHTNPDETWTDWLASNDDKDDAEKLGALREIIVQTARTWIDSGEITAEWANKKLTSLGITDQVDQLKDYTLETSASGTVQLVIRARNRADAETEFRNRLAAAPMVTVTGPDAPYAPKFVSGPEDHDPNAVVPDAPATVADTLTKLRQVILLGNISGPRFDCDSGASRVLASYGLAPVPARKTFVVTRPAAADMRTTVEAYDEASAERVAEYRWDNHQAGYTPVNVDAIGEAVVTAADAS